MPKPGQTNSIIDVPGILVGHYTDLQKISGTTAVVCPDGATGGVDVRGSAPGTRETDLLDPSNLVEQVNAVLLCGGSLYGLAAADGAVRWLAEKKWGFPLEQGFVAPIVPCAALFDLGRGPEYIPNPTADWGRMACEAANDENIEQGSFGAGTGAMAGGIKGGIGSASLELDNGLTVGALIAVNSLGAVINSKTGQAWEIDQEINNEFGDQAKRSVKLPPLPQAEPAKNTTIGVVATNAKLTKPQAQKLAQMAQDGLARAIRPAHTMFDGDTIFCLGTGKQDLPDTPGFFAAPKAQAINELGDAIAQCVSRSIVKAILKAQSLGQMKAFKDLEDR